MSLYGPKLNLPKINLPNPANPSWDFEKERKIIGGALIAIIIIFLLVLLMPNIIEGINNINFPNFNSSVNIVWRNNPLDITQGIKEAQLDLILTNNSEELIEETLFNITTDSQEIIIFCPNSIYDPDKSAYVIENLAPQDKRKIPCIIRRNASTPVFSGTYTININTTLGNAITRFEIITK
ncbi:MAG: hypothetical protein PHY04_01660 [Candidatus ainarchaeum sp.]|jgi:hypothetical protein|nr:hypothetical protein [Candidatus ainarchaeum sp.]MDD4467676.1 hypothetical protein [Candidatus ainarchaeum sp.]HPM85496.1 hypothetical protein [archaeon]